MNDTRKKIASVAISGALLTTPACSTTGFSVEGRMHLGGARHRNVGAKVQKAEIQSRENTIALSKGQVKDIPKLHKQVVEGRDTEPRYKDLYDAIMGARMEPATIPPEEEVEGK